MKMNQVHSDRKKYLEGLGKQHTGACVFKKCQYIITITFAILMTNWDAITFQ